MKKQNAVVYCRKTEHNTLAFYLRLDGEEIFLFNTDYYQIIFITNTITASVQISSLSLQRLSGIRRSEKELSA